jgi:hypothetical protein
MLVRRPIAFLLSLVLWLGVSLGASADDTILAVTAVRVNPGQLDTYVARVSKLQGVIERVGGSGTVRMWQATSAGEATGTVFVAVQHPSLAAYAESTAKTQADAEFQKLIAGLDDIRTLVSSSLLQNIAGGGGDDPGEVLQTITVRVNPGRQDDYLAKIAQLQAIADRTGVTSKFRAWRATAAGPATGNIIVGSIHADLATYASNTTKMQADPEWQQVIAGLDEMRTVVSSGLSRSLSP